MPDTGPWAPERTLVAVRAMVPVTGMPPNTAEPILAKPCATSSQLERWRRPVMPSATTADSSDSIEPSSAKAAASGSTASTLSAEKSGSAGQGSVRGMPPKREPIVSTGSDSRKAASEATTMATSMPGQLGRKRFSPATTRMVRRATPAAAGVKVPATAASASSLGTRSPGSGPDSVSPNRSRSWLAAMMTAMPAVKPTVTG